MLARPCPAGGAGNSGSNAEPPASHKLAVATDPDLAQSGSARDAPVGSPFFSVHLAHDVDFEVAFRQQALELGVLQLQGLQSLYVRRRQTGKVLAPDVDGLLTDLVLLGGLGNRRAVRLP